MSQDGLQTGTGARLARVGGLLTRTAWRQIGLSIRGRLSSAARRRALAEQTQIRTAEDVAQALGELKGALMKIGQIISMNVDALPPAAQAALRALQADVPPMSFDLARGVIEGELGGALTQHFRVFDEIPLAAASIGQVHRAILHDGREVAVKVQYPGVADAIQTDLRVIRRLGLLAGLASPALDQDALLDEITDLLEGELDYRLEADHQQAFATHWADHPLIRVPAVVPEHSTRRVLCQARARGLIFEDFLRTARPAERQRAAELLYDFAFDSLHLGGLFHGDPHPGNYLFAPDGGLIVLDYGCTRRFSRGFVDALQQLITATIETDRDRFRAAMTAMGGPRQPNSSQADGLWAFFRHHFEPMAEDADFTYDRAYARRGRAVLAPSELRRLGLPRELLVFNRISLGLNTLLVDLGARSNYHRKFQRYIA